MNKGFTTRSLHTTFPQEDAYRALHMPIYDGVAFDFDSAETMEAVFSGRRAGHAYARTSNPTVEYFEKKVKNVTGAHAVLAFSSGMAAITTAILSMVGQGDNLVTSNRLFGHSYAFFKTTLPGFGVEVRFVDLTDEVALAGVVDERTRLIFFETITNPQLEILDISRLAAFAHARNLVLVGDSTTTPPNVFMARSFGVDVEVMSTTKFISGGAAAFGGVAIDHGTFAWEKVPALASWHSRFGIDALIARMRKEMFRHLGGSMTAHTAHFMNLGLDILTLRVDKCVDNCMKLGVFLKEQPQVKSVNYPGLPDHVLYDLAQLQFAGKPGAILTFDLASRSVCFDFMNALKVIRRATNLNDNKTLIIHPHSTIYSEFSLAERAEMKIPDTQMRLSVGIEDVADLIGDISQALSVI
ncbi:MAG: O-acetylhomoserine aminocarboxypropyltransferase/cysteine synthase [Marinilabiliaceae bacterium]|nr:O-acetylhomoserine aminocarboxypropyltransferase/cysteine synthase [Marinilabiliaceae bacterium]